MKKISNIIDDREIQSIRNYYERNTARSYVNWQDEKGQIIDTRCEIDPRDPEFSIIESIVKKDFKNPKLFWSAYQRQNRPHNIHTDDYGIEHKGSEIYTYVISFDTIPEFKTFIWKNTAENNKELHEYVANWGKIKYTLPKLNNLSETEDLEHTFDQNQNAYMSDYLELDGIYTYEKAHGILFNAKQFHCTSNWVKYNKFPYRELLQIHVMLSPKDDGRSQEI
jgi:hypothetical protein